MFNDPMSPNDAVNGLGYISDKHLFQCNNPVVMQEAFHVYNSYYYCITRSSNPPANIGYSLLTG